MRILVSIFFYGLLLDALLAVAGEWLPITPLRVIVAWAVFCAGLVLYALTAFLPRLPRGLIVSSFLFFVWAEICGGFPLVFVLPDHHAPVIAGSLLAVAAGAFVLYRRWWKIPPPLESPRFSWAGFGLVAALTVFALPLLCAAAFINSTGVYLETTSGGFVKLRPEGVILEERDMTKGDKHVRLISMVHIGEKSFYDSVLSSIPTNGTAIVLLEGVTDDKELLKKRFSYSKIAGLLGLDAQEGTSFHRKGKAASAESKPDPKDPPKVEYRRADIDISMFQPLTLEFMNAMAAMLSDPTFGTVINTMEDPDSPFKVPNADKIVMHDILDKRNDHLISEIGRALQTSQTVIVPWGALHLPFIEASLKEQGFQNTGSVNRPIIHFWRKNPPLPAQNPTAPAK